MHRIVGFILVVVSWTGFANDQNCEDAAWAVLKPQVHNLIDQIKVFDFDIYGLDNDQWQALEKEVDRIGTAVATIDGLAKAIRLNGSRLFADKDLGRVIVGIKDALFAITSACDSIMDNPSSRFGPGLETLVAGLKSTNDEASEALEEMHAQINSLSELAEKVKLLQTEVTAILSTDFAGVKTRYGNGTIAGTWSYNINEKYRSTGMNSGFNTHDYDKKPDEQYRNYFGLYSDRKYDDDAFTGSRTPYVVLKFGEKNRENSLYRLGAYSELGNFANRVVALIDANRISATQFDKLLHRILELSREIIDTVQIKVNAEIKPSRIEFKLRDVKAWVDREYQGGRDDRRGVGVYGQVVGLFDAYVSARLGSPDVTIDVGAEIGKTDIPKRLAQLERMIAGFERPE